MRPLYRVPQTAGEMHGLLVRYGIPTEQYGKGKAKTIEQLFEEVRKRECTLVTENGRLLRLTEVACLFVYQGGNVLAEDKQVFPDGRERRRTLDASVGEKIKAGDSPCDAVKEITRDELPTLQSYTAAVEELNDRVDRNESPSYPGLPTAYRK